jgi:ABC-type proline/glycine betaine transport system permease subunit
MAPLTAHNTPIWVSPTFMLETSMAMIVVSSDIGFNGIGRNVGEG